MLHAAHEGRAPALVAYTPPFAAEPPNKRILRIRSEERSPEEMLHDLLEPDRFSPCRLHPAIYEPIVYYLGIAGGIVKRATTIGRASRPSAENVRAEGAGGGSGIRTHDTVSRIHAFQACALSHSAIPPGLLRRWQYNPARSGDKPAARSRQPAHPQKKPLN